MKTGDPDFDFEEKVGTSWFRFEIYINTSQQGFIEREWYVLREKPSTLVVFKKSMKEVSSSEEISLHLT